MKVILDTNFLIYCAKNKLDYLEEIGNLINEGFELVVPMQVIEEMKKLKDDKWKKVSGKDKDAIALALQLLDVNKVKKVKIKGESVDEGIVNLANENKKNIVCTLDREMRHNLPRVILINKFKKLMITR
ncbi:MAG: PIN domain-containing protein [Nanoarchaeota archaeon]|nr:PIN domain-containing protein [Nanoarchaeota archaeon]